MNTQRETDIMLLEAQEVVRKIFEEWLRDYLGSRGERQAPPDGGAGLQGSSGIAQQYNTGY